MIRLEKFEKDSYKDLISWVDNKEMLMQFAGPAFDFPLTNEQLDKSISDVFKLQIMFIHCANVCTKK